MFFSFRYLLCIVLEIHSVIIYFHLIDFLSFFCIPDIEQRGHSALQVWGISVLQDDQDAVVDDENKEAFGAHVDAMFADMK